ncbi:DNA methyltransferase [Salinisphaera sp. T5B8]|uniref:TRM11 family SAM-dependent methyltransferase n=1 Tax=Salinisphaera sp. T5B8 TaxID=1304154 RepID=UPI003342BD00
MSISRVGRLAGIDLEVLFSNIIERALVRSFFALKDRGLFASIAAEAAPYYYSGDKFPHLSHYSFRYPAKFHPPVAAQLIRDFTEPGELVLDPFCGSGTLNIEAAALGRRSFGTDIDPLAVFVASAKTVRISEKIANRHFVQIYKSLSSIPSWAGRIGHGAPLNDHSLRQHANENGLFIPHIPRLTHWYQPYAALDLAKIRKFIEAYGCCVSFKKILWLTFASVVRSSSNADPTPVSGLEVTKIMREKISRGFAPDVFSIFLKNLEKNITRAKDYSKATTHSSQPVFSAADVTKLTELPPGPFDAVITSPPYHSAVDYYRRHTLEMYWLDLTTTHEERLALKPLYLGQGKVAKSNALFDRNELRGQYAKNKYSEILQVSDERARAFKHYALGIQLAIENIDHLLAHQGRAVFVVGDSVWQGKLLSTVALIQESAEPYLRLGKTFCYSLKNRYMSYARRNGADIKTEYVLELIKK